MYIANAWAILKCLVIVGVLCEWDDEPDSLKASVAYGVISLWIWTFWYLYLKLPSLPSEVEIPRIRYSAWTKSRHDSQCLDLQRLSAVLILYMIILVLLNTVVTYITTCFNVDETRCILLTKCMLIIRGFFRINQLFSSTALIDPVWNGGVVWSLWERNRTLIILSINLRLQLRYHTAKSRVHPMTGLCEICSRRSDTGTSFSPSTPIFPCRCHSASALCSSSFQSLVRRTSGRSPVVSMQNSVLSNIREHWKETHLHIVFQRVHVQSHAR